MAVAAARHAVAGSHPPTDSVWFATASPPYLDKTNGTAIHAALGLDPAVGAYDVIGSTRSAMGALRAAWRSAGSSLVVSADVRVGLPGGPDESSGGDGASALMIASDEDAPVLAELISWTTSSVEFLDQWRVPGEATPQRWEERFGETRYTSLGTDAVTAALAEAGVTADQVDHLIVAGGGDRAAAAVASRSGVLPDRHVDRLGSIVGNTGAAHPGLLLAQTLEAAVPFQVIALVVLADGADVIMLRTTPALAGHVPAASVAEQVAGGGPVSYGKYLAWRGLLSTEPPRRPEPQRPSATAAARSTEWKFGFVGSERDGGRLHLPPAPLDDRRHPMANALGTIAAFTVDRLAYSPSPPVVFAVIDFDGGGRLPMELTDVDPGDVQVKQRVEMTFRCLFTAGGIRNYFWKARPIRAAVGNADHGES
jgi:3-oxoacyl-[acyl-carrier-protein] synthase III